MRADPASTGGQFTIGLLDPESPVPASVHGRSARRYGVYRNNVTMSLVRAMAANFPVVQRLLGEEYFEGFARLFVQQHPPSSPLLFEYGAGLETFLEEAEDLKEYPYLGDVARLEQQMRLSHHELDRPCLSAQDLSQLSEDELMRAVFERHPATAIVDSKFALLSIHRANRSAVPGHVEDIFAAQTVLVTRPQHEVLLNPLNASQLTFFNALLAGAAFGDASDSVFETDSDFDLSEAIGLMLRSGAFQSIGTGEL